MNNINVPDKEDCLFIISCLIEGREKAIKKSAKIPYYPKDVINGLKNEIFNLNLIKDYIEKN